MKCPQCGSAVRAQVHFCPECGAELAREESSRARACPHCGAQIDARSTLCPQCGEQTSGERPASQSERLAKMRARVEAEMRMPSGRPAERRPARRTRKEEARAEPRPPARARRSEKGSVAPRQPSPPQVREERPPAEPPPTAAAEAPAKQPFWSWVSREPEVEAPEAEPPPPAPPEPEPTPPPRAQAPEAAPTADVHPPQPVVVNGRARPSLVPEAATPPAVTPIEPEAAPAPAERTVGARLARLLTVAALLATVTLATVLLVGADRVGLVLPDLPALRNRPAPTPAPQETPLPVTSPEATPSPAPTDTPEPATPTPEPTAPAEPTPEPAPQVHTVQQGETLLSIAQRYGVTVAEIIRANNLASEVIRPGQELQIPAQAEPEPREPTTHVVQRGENLVMIARQYNVSLTELMEANGITNANLVKIGQELQIPGVGAPAPTPAPTEAPTATPPPTATATAVAAAATAALTATPADSTAYPYAAPKLLSPANGETVKGAEDVVLNWASVGLLGEDTFYVVNLRREDPSLPIPNPGWTPTTGWRIPASYYPGADAASRRFYWSVTVMKRGLDGDPPTALGPASEERWFIWE